MPAILGHAALAARDPERLAGFYAELLGWRVVRRTANELGGALVELGGRPEEEHELVLAGRAEARHLAFRVDSLDELLARHAGCSDVLLAHCTGVAVSFFLLDPEGNAVELYWATGRGRLPEPVPVDLAEGADAVLALLP